MFVGFTADVPSDTNIGRGEGITFLPPADERKDMAKRATGNGYYTIGNAHFKARKGKFLPENYDEVFYDDANLPEDSGAIDSDTLRARKINEAASDSRRETLAEPAVETQAEPESGDEPKGRAKKAK